MKPPAPPPDCTRPSPGRRRAGSNGHSWIWFLSCTLSTVWMLPHIDEQVAAHQRLAAVLLLGGLYLILVSAAPCLWKRWPLLRRWLRGRRAHRAAERRAGLTRRRPSRHP